MHKLFFINLLKRWFRISFLLIFLCFIYQFLALFCFLLKINQKSIGMYCSFLYFCIRKQKKISLLHSDRIRAKYKDVVIQCCASGGRANWGTSYFFPAIAMASLSLRFLIIPSSVPLPWSIVLMWRWAVVWVWKSSLRIWLMRRRRFARKPFLSIRKFAPLMRRWRLIISWDVSIVIWKRHPRQCNVIRMRWRV